MNVATFRTKPSSYTAARWLYFEEGLYVAEIYLALFIVV
jgi:hypothetical protein